MSIPVSQEEDLVMMDKEKLSQRIITLETFIWNLAQRYFAQDDFSRKETARARDGTFELNVNGREAFAHWLASGGPAYFDKHFGSIDEVMKAFRRDGVGEKPPPPD